MGSPLPELPQASPAGGAAPGEEENLHAHECARCGEVMLHLCELLEDYPLWRLWSLACGECGSQAQGWESVEVNWRAWAGQAVGQRSGAEAEEIPELSGAL